jgi:hypothetical protein
MRQRHERRCRRIAALSTADSDVALADEILTIVSGVALSWLDRCVPLTSLTATVREDPTGFPAWALPTLALLLERAGQSALAAEMAGVLDHKPMP